MHLVCRNSPQAHCTGWCVCESETDDHGMDDVDDGHELVYFFSSCVGVRSQHKRHYVKSDMERACFRFEGDFNRE